MSQHFRNALSFLTAIFAIAASARLLQSQTPPAPPPEPIQNYGGFVPGQHREPGNPVQIARGKSIYGINCGGCHGTDLRGGDMGGPNLLRSQVALSDKNGEKILPIIQGARQNEGMPAIPIKPEDGLAVAAFVRSVLETIGEQGMPPQTGKPAPSVLVGNAKEGEAYFAAKCAGCHSATGDLRGIASKVPDPKDLQTAWVSGEVRGQHPPNADPDAVDPRAVKVSITFASGEHVDGRLLHIDDFLVTVREAGDGAGGGAAREGGSSVHSFRRNGTEPKIEIHDPMQIHRDLLTQYTDRDIHDITAFLANLK